MAQIPGLQCAYCGAVAPAGSPRCPRCGTPLAAPGHQPAVQATPAWHQPEPQRAQAAPAWHQPEPQRAQAAPAWHQPEPQRAENHMARAVEGTQDARRASGSGAGSDLRAKVFAIVGGVVTLALILIGATYIFGLSIPEDWSSGGAARIYLDQPVQGEFSTFQSTGLYELRLNENVEVAVTATGSGNIYVELQREGRPFARGMNALTRPLTPGTYQVFLRPQNEGTREFTLSVAAPGAAAHADAGAGL